MGEPLAGFWLCFVPLFVAVDAVGVLPMFLGLTEDVPDADLPRIIRQSEVTAIAVALAFLAIGTGVLGLLGITVHDFMVAGGILLFAIAMGDLLASEKLLRRVDPDSLGAVPIGVPLITGPAVLTTSVLLLNEHGLAPTALALVANVLLAGFAFRRARRMHGFLGKAGAKTVSKVASLLLASIAVMIVRRGVAGIVRAGWPPD